MTASFRSRLPGQTPSRGRRNSDPEERFTRRVTLGFIGLIVAVVAIVLVAFVVDYWNTHLKSVATVGDVSITRDQWASRTKLEFTRLDQQEKKTREAIAAQILTPDAAAVRLQEIQSAKENVAQIAIDSLIDLELKVRLAKEQGLAVTDADVDAAIEEEQLTEEARQVTAVVIEPNADLPLPGAQQVQAAYATARDAYAAATAGTDLGEVARLYSTDASADAGGDIGFVTESTDLDPVFLDLLFAQEPGVLTPLVRGADGAWRFGRVETVRPGSSDASLEASIRETVGWDAYKDQVRKEALAAKLEEKITAEATAGDVEQADLRAIVLLGDTAGAPEEDEGAVRAAHILYSPDDDPGAATSVPADSIAWDKALQDANKAAGAFRREADQAARAALFAERAKAESDDTGSGARGGELGYFTRGQMVPEFADPLFDTPDLAAGAVVGPVRSQYGYHVILFQERIPGMADRLATLGERLSAADVATVAAELSDGAEAVDGGALGWVARSELEEAAADAVFALEPGARTEPLPLSDGYYVYELIGKEARPLDTLQRARVEASAFDRWFAEQRTKAQVDQIINQDPDIFGMAPTVGG